MRIVSLEQVSSQKKIQGVCSANLDCSHWPVPAKSAFGDVSDSKFRSAPVTPVTCDVMLHADNSEQLTIAAGALSPAFGGNLIGMSSVRFATSAFVSDEYLKSPDRSVKSVSGKAERKRPLLRASWWHLTTAEVPSTAFLQPQQQQQQLPPPPTALQ
jgi:hypothetical protein